MTVCELAKIASWHDFFNQADFTDSPHHWHRQQYADIGQQLPGHMQPVKMLGKGMESAAVELSDGNVAKMSYKPIVNEAARAGIDIPTLGNYRHELGSGHGNPAYMSIQPKAEVANNFWENLVANRDMARAARKKGLYPVDMNLGIPQTGTILENGIKKRVLLDRGAILDQLTEPWQHALHWTGKVHGPLQDLLAGAYKRPNLTRLAGALPLINYLTKNYVKNKENDLQTTTGLGLIGAAPWAIRGIDIHGHVPIPFKNISVKGGIPAAALAGLGGLALLTRPKSNA